MMPRPSEESGPWGGTGQGGAGQRADRSPRCLYHTAWKLDLMPEQELVRVFKDQIWLFVNKLACVPNAPRGAPL